MHSAAVRQDIEVARAARTVFHPVLAVAQTVSLEDISVYNDVTLYYIYKHNIHNICIYIIYVYTEYMYIDTYIYTSYNIYIYTYTYN